MSELTDWLQQEERRLTDWARRAQNPVGFGYLNDVGEQINAHERSLLITARMTYVFSLAVLRGDESARTYAAHGINALSAFWDAEHGGWFSRIEPGSHVETDKSAYDHAFVLLASATATVAGIDGAADVLRRAIDVIENRFWSETDRALVDSFSADWATAEKYRGGNANMHFVEACLVAAFATGDDVWLDRALSIADRIINVSARDNAWRIAEHFDEHWQRLLEYNHDRPADQFRPYGYLVGHSFEWARLLLHLDSALRSRGRTEPWLREAAVGLWNVSITAWNIDGHPGFVYTQDWNDNPVIDLRLHWVICEAVAAAWALSEVTGDEEYAAWFRRFWQYIREQFVDEEHGSWHHELSPAGEPSAVIWPGKPDVYHAYNAVILPLGTFTPSAVQSAAEA